LVLAFLGSPAMAGSTHLIHANPCVLGSGAEANCTGAIRVTDNIEITSAGVAVSDEAQSTANYVQFNNVYSGGQNSSYASHQSSASSYSYSTENGNNQEFHSQAPRGVPVGVRRIEVRTTDGHQSNASVNESCSAAIAQRVPCNGQWVVVGDMAPPVALPPPPMTYAPPPTYYMPPPQQLAQISPMFFYGGMNNGVGYNMMTGYGGGGAIFVGGGSRFSGVRERSPTPLVPPVRRQPPPPHNPPPPPPN